MKGDRGLRAKDMNCIVKIAVFAMQFFFFRNVKVLVAPDGGGQTDSAQRLSQSILPG